MKKLYTLLLSLFCVLSASALPAELYLVGNFNNWSTPDQDKDLFILTSTGTAGIYSGTFDIPVQQFHQLRFRVYAAKTNNLEDTYGTYEYSSQSMSLFSDHTREVKLIKNASPLRVINWEGGKITFTCTLDKSTETMNLTLITPDQPATPPCPDNIWIIGDFNDWAVPSASSDNGAIKMTKHDNFLNKPYYIAPNAAIPSGKARFIYYYLDPADNTAKFIEGSQLTQVVGMYRCNESSTGFLSSYWDLNRTTYIHIHDNLSDARAKATNILNYTGPDLSFELFWKLDRETPEACDIYWEDAPVNDVNNLYLYIENIDTGEKILTAPDEETEWQIIWSTVLKGNLRIWLTESKSLPVDNKWGIYSDTDIEFEWGVGIHPELLRP